MTKEELQSKTITWLRFPLAVAIVLVHTVDYDLRAVVLQIDYSNLSGMDIYNVIRFLVSDVFCRVATSCFCIFSGFLFFYKNNVWNINVYFKKIKRKTRTLALPYVLWNIIPVAITALLAVMKFEDSMSDMNKLWEGGILKIFWNYLEGNYPGIYPYNIPLWFLRDLIVIVFLSPLVYYLVKYLKWYCIFILGFLFITKFWFPIVFLNIRTLFFFSLGAFFSVHGKNMIVELQKRKLFWFFSTLIAFSLLMYYNGTDKYGYFADLFNITGSITTIIIASILVEHGRVSINSFLAKTSFFIFASHAGLSVLGFSKMSLNFIFVSNNAFILTMKYFLVPVICVSVCVGLYYIAQKITPKLLGILTGSR